MYIYIYMYACIIYLSPKWLCFESLDVMRLLFDLPSLAQPVDHDRMKSI